MANCEILFKTGKIIIDFKKCQDCRGCACVKACSLFGRGLFRIKDGRPVLIASVAEAQKACIECLACELYCCDYGNKGLTIDLDMLGLNELKTGLV